MDGVFYHSRRWRFGRLQLSPEHRSVSSVMLFFLLLGVLFGSVFGMYAASFPEAFSAFFTQDSLRLSLFVSVSSFLLPFAFSVLVSGSFYGVILAPVLMLACGAALGALVARAVSLLSSFGLVFSLVVFGIDSMLFSPCAVLFSADCFLSSRGLIRSRLGRFLPQQQRFFLPSHFLLLLSAVLFSVLYHLYCFPLIALRLQHYFL